MSEEDYPYLVDEDDHCETPVEAYRDLKPFLKKLCKKLGKSKSELIIYGKTLFYE